MFLSKILHTSKVSTLKSNGSFYYCVVFNQMVHSLVKEALHIFATTLSLRNTPNRLKRLLKGFHCVGILSSFHKFLHLLKRTCTATCLFEGSFIFISKKCDTSLWLLTEVIPILHFIHKETACTSKYCGRNTPVSARSSDEIAGGSPTLASRCMALFFGVDEASHVNQPIAKSEWVFNFIWFLSGNQLAIGSMDIHESSRWSEDSVDSPTRVIRCVVRRLDDRKIEAGKPTKYVMLQKSCFR